MKKQCTKTTGKLALRLALVVVMLVTLVCFGAVVASAAEKSLHVEIDDLKFTNVTQSASNPFDLSMVYGAAWQVEWADGADVGIDAADAGKVSLKIDAEIDNASVGAVRYITVSYTLVTDDEEMRAKYSTPSAQLYAVEVTPKELTWNGGNANIAFTYGDIKVEINNSKLSNMPTLSGVLPGDDVTATINAILEGDAVTQTGAGKHTAWTKVKATSSNPNYTIADLVIDANVQKLTLVSTDLGEYFFTWGDTVAVEALGFDANGNAYKLVVTYDPTAEAGNVGSYRLQVATPDVNNIQLANNIAVSAAYHIQPRAYEIAFPDKSVIGDRNNVFHPTVLGDIPADVLAQIAYTSGGEAFTGTSVYGVYVVKADLPSNANYIFKNAAGETVTSLTATVTVKSQELIPAGSDEKPYQIVLYSENGYVGSFTASVTTPELARKTMRGFRYYTGYTLKINGAKDETFTAVIPIDASLYQKGANKLTINDIYVYETATDEMVKANGHADYIVSIKDGCYYVQGVSGDSTVTFVVAPQYTPSFWLTGLGIAILALIVLALIVLMLIIGMYLRRREEAENAALVLEDGEDTEVAPIMTAEADLDAAQAEKLDEMAEKLEAEPVAEETAEALGVAEAVEEAKAELMSDLPELEEKNDDAVEALAIVDTDDDDDEDEDSFGGFATADLDFFDAVEEPERYAALLAQEQNGEVHIVTRYRRSYQSKLAQSQGNVQDYYNEIKNALLSYKGIKSRISWNYEAFNRGRVHVAKIIAKTKTLYVYLAIDPATLEDTKYTFVDVSAKKKYASVPVLMKVKGERKFKHVLELIDKIGAEDLALPKLEREPVDYRIPYATTEDLVAQGLVKKLVAGVPVVTEEEAPAEEIAEAEATPITPATEEQTVTFIAPTDTPAVEAAAEEIVAEEAAAEEVPAAAETETAEDENKEV